MAGQLADLAAILEAGVPVDQVSPVLTQADALLETVRPGELGFLQNIVSALCSWLRANELTPSAPGTGAPAQVAPLCRALGLVAKALMQDAGSEGVAIRKGILSSASVLLQRHSRHPSMTRSCLEVFATLSAVGDSDVIMTRLKVVPAILELLVEHRDDPEVLEDAVTALALLARRTRHRRSLTQGGGVAAVIGFLNETWLSRASALVVAACRFLSNFAVKEECCLVVHQKGGILSLMVAFAACVDRGLDELLSPVDARTALLSAIRTCSSDCGEVQNAVFEVPGWLELLAKVLQDNPDNDSLLQAAIGIVREASRHAVYREEVIGLGFVHTAVVAMRQFPGNHALLKEACGFFGNLATDPELRIMLGEGRVEQRGFFGNKSTPLEKRIMLGEGAVLQEVVGALARCRGAADRKVAKLALGALSNLASCEGNREKLVVFDCVPVILGAARIFMSNVCILEYALGAISHLTMHDLGNRQLVQGGVVEALLLFTQEHREDLHIVARSLAALRRLLRISSPVHKLAVCREVITAGRSDGAFGIQVIVEALQCHVYDEDVVREAALVLGVLAGDSFAESALMAFAVQPCVKAMELHQRDAPVCDALAEFVAQLPLEFDEQWSQDALSGQTFDAPRIGRRLEGFRPEEEDSELVEPAA